MDGMMDCTVAGFRLCVLWRQAADGVLLMMVLACLYFLARLQGTDVDNMPQGCPASLELEGRTDIIGDRLLKEIAMGMTGHTVLVPIDVKAAETGTVRKLKQIKGETLSVQGMSALASISEEAPQKEKVAVTPLLTICLYGNGGMPEKTVYTCKNDNIAVDSFQKPRRLGKEFCGWYLDPACTRPFEGLDGNILSLELYAGWKEFDGFTSDENGRIIGYTDLSVVADGILTFPRSMDCTGIESGSLGGLEELVIEIYIPSNITYIAPGAFDHLYFLMFIEVAEDNPAYYSVDGILYAADGEMVAYPGGR